MAKSKDDIKYGTAQAKLSEDEALRVSYKAGAPLEGGKIADSEPVDLFSGAQNIPRQEGVIALSDPADLFSAASNISNSEQERTTNHPDSGSGREAAAGSTT
ncbi:hypothetical protein RJ639_036454 [Escallonia herrerae]|uniref:Seed maturation protein n=1 Tax=Escallonia herrerae TaxID=1293975 RepID=A0AA88X6R7_9ASTE|nr:hypothetical protein RJ639_036454 [Escallonia herrerae]